MAIPSAINAYSRVKTAGDAGANPTAAVAKHSCLLRFSSTRGFISLQRLDSLVPR